MAPMTSAANEMDALADRLRPHYSRFLGSFRDQILLTGHSHQAWPDVARDGHLAAWDDAATMVDRKWERVFGEIIPEFQRLVARRIGSSRPKDLAIAPNTHELAYRLLSSFPRSASVLTTDSEFHSLRRQLDRLSESGLRVIRVRVEDEGPKARAFAERFVAAAERARPTLAALSYVFFTTSRLLVELEPILDALARLSIPVLIDVYHAFNVVDFSTDRWPGEVFVVGGGYKYAQCGEGACWMLLPESASKLRPRQTGWFARFESLDAMEKEVQYGEGGLRFFGSTFDPTSVYRAVYVFRWMEEMGLSTSVLRAQSLRQTSAIIERFDALGLEKHGLVLRTPREARGGFIALAAPKARTLRDRLEWNGVHTDVRGELLRLGPAPYLGSEEIAKAMEILAKLAS